MSQTYPSSLYKKIVAVQDNHFWFTGRNKMIESFVCDVTPKPYAHKSFLEVGCGTGIVMRVLEHMGFSCTGLDVNAAALSYASGITKGTLVRQSIFGYVPKKQFDVVGSFDVLEHIQQDSAFLRVCHRLLVPHGYLLLTVPAGMWLWSEVDAASGHVRRYEYDELVAKLQSAGFTVVSSLYWNVLLLPIYRLWHRHAAKHPKDVVAAHLKEMSPWVNVLLTWILSMEHALSRYIRFSIGATLVVCAQKRNV